MKSVGEIAASIKSKYPHAPIIIQPIKAGGEMSDQQEQYVIRDSVSGEFISVASLFARLSKWTQEPPTEPGWYWCYLHGELTAVEVVEDSRELYASSNGTKNWLVNWSNECKWQKMSVPNPPEIKVKHED